jgi:hypothetical protein
MPNESSAGNAASVFRVDKFIVPADALPTFMDQVRRTQRALDALAGCQQNLVLTQTAGPGEFNVVTLVEWADAQALAAAKAVMQQKYAEEGFDATAFMQRLGVRADMGLYSNA